MPRSPSPGRAARRWCWSPPKPSSHEHACAAKASGSRNDRTNSLNPAKKIPLQQVRLVEKACADVDRVAPVAEVDVDNRGDPRRRRRLHSGGRARDDTAAEGPRCGSAEGRSAGGARRRGREAAAAGLALGARRADTAAAREDDEAAASREEEAAAAMEVVELRNEDDGNGDGGGWWLAKRGDLRRAECGGWWEKEAERRNRAVYLDRRLGRSTAEMDPGLVGVVARPWWDGKVVDVAGWLAERLGLGMAA